MALYPTLFVAYLGHFAPSMVAGNRACSARDDCDLHGVEHCRRAGRRRWLRLAEVALLVPFGDGRDRDGVPAGPVQAPFPRVMSIFSAAC